MQTNLISSVFLFWSLLGFTLVAEAQSFDPNLLSDPGKQAFKTLIAVDRFALGGIGYGGNTSEGEKALDELVKEKHGVSAFKHLLIEATPEGALYALLGLKLLKCNCFNDEYQRFLKRVELGDRKSWGSRIISAGNVDRMSGCIVFQEPRLSVAKNIDKEIGEVKWKLREVTVPDGH